MYKRQVEHQTILLLKLLVAVDLELLVLLLETMVQILLLKLVMDLKYGSLLVVAKVVVPLMVKTVDQVVMVDQ